MSAARPSPSPPPQSSQSRVEIEVEEVTTIVKSPLLRPNPAFLKVIHYGGGQGETFTLGEILEYVKKYIDDKKLCNQHDPYVIHCKGNDLGVAFGVDQITIPHVLNMFLKHCTVENDSRLKISKQVNTRPLCDNQSPSSSSSSSSLSSNRGDVVCSSETPVSLPSSSSFSDLPSPIVSSTTPTPRSNSSHTPTQSTSSLSESIPAAGPSTIVSNLEIESLRTNNSVDAPNTSFSIMAMDETDGGVPWSCQVEVEQSDVETGGHHSLVVECSSDNFSVEYELVSSSEAESYKLEDTEDSKSPLESTPATAFYLVCEESDIEYLADYSDTDSDSDAELGEEDKWECNMCHFKNSALFRNCEKCWSIRLDWLPSKIASGSASPCNFPNSSQDSAIGTISCCSQENVDCELNSNNECNIDSKADVKPDGDECDTKVKDVRKRNYSSCLSDSQEELKGKAKVARIGKGHCEKEEKDTCPKDPCVICLTRPKTACIIHGKTGHQVCCYGCARMLKKKRKPCPICRRPIQRVVRNYF